MSFSKILMALCLSLVLASCSRHREAELVSVQLTDHNGMVETFNTNERLQLFTKQDFTAPQPYAQITRVYKAADTMTPSSCTTSYFSSGQIQKSLEASGTQASGFYREWHSNGQLKTEVQVLGGVPQLTLEAERTWIFDGEAKAWDEAGNLKARFYYENGLLQGLQETFHSSGKAWKRYTAKENQVEGKLSIYTDKGTLLKEEMYQSGKKDGKCLRFWPDKSIASDETYQKGDLLSGTYHSIDGQLICKVENGKGKQALFRKNSLLMTREICKGRAEGLVEVFSKTGILTKVFSLRNGQKEGKEVHYFQTAGMQPKIELQWHVGKLCGVVKTWYENGQLESIRELDENCQAKMLSVWFENGSQMLVESYSQGKLIHGDYYQKNVRNPCSKVTKGSGLATIHDSKGYYIREVEYRDGTPVLE